MSGQRTAVITLLALVLGGAGCLRFGYQEHERAREKPDAGGDDAGSRGGSGESGSGSGGNGSGAGGAAGSGGRNTTPQAGKSGSDSGMDASTDAAMRDAADGDDDDAGEMDASQPAPWCPNRSDILFCNGFEDDEFEKWSYTIVDNGTADPSTAEVVSGAKSLRATTGQSGMNNQARKATQTLANTKSGDLWLRYDYYVPSSVVVTQHFSAGVMSEIMEPFAGFSLLVMPTRVDISSMSGFFQGSMAFPRDRWVCVELHVRVSATSGVFEVYLDGDLAVKSPANTNTLPADGYSVAEVGIHYAEQGQGPVEAYVDNVAVGRMRIPCN